MKKIRCIIADDEPIARKILENYISELPNLELVKSCKDAFEVIEILGKEDVDLLFLDINMPKLSGIGLIKTLRLRPEIILTTAYPEYALEGFELSVIDYLLKPFSLERFIQAVMKVVKKGSVEKETIIGKNKEESNSSIFVKSEKKLIRVQFNSIYYIEAYGNYIKIYSDEMILTQQTLTEFQKKLPQNDFLRIHKSFVINFNKLKLVDGYQMVLKNNASLPISKSYRKSILAKIEGKS